METPSRCLVPAFLDTYEDVAIEEIDEALFKKHIFGNVSADTARRQAGLRALDGDDKYLPRFILAERVARRFHAALQGAEAAKRLDDEMDAAAEVAGYSEKVARRSLGDSVTAASTLVEQSDLKVKASVAVGMPGKRKRAPQDGGGLESQALLVPQARIIKSAGSRKV